MFGCLLDQWHFVIVGRFIDTAYQVNETQIIIIIIIIINNKGFKLLLCKIYFQTILNYSVSIWLAAGQQIKKT